MFLLFLNVSITNLRHLSFIPKFFHVNFPEAFSNELEKCKNDEEVKQVGIEWTTAQCKELVKAGYSRYPFPHNGQRSSSKKHRKRNF